MPTAQIAGPGIRVSVVGNEWKWHDSVKWVGLYPTASSGPPGAPSQPIGQELAQVTRLYILCGWGQARTHVPLQVSWSKWAWTQKLGSS